MKTHSLPGLAPGRIPAFARARTVGGFMCRNEAASSRLKVRILISLPHSPALTLTADVCGRSIWGTDHNGCLGERHNKSTRKIRNRAAIHCEDFNEPAAR